MGAIHEALPAGPSARRHMTSVSAAGGTARSRADGRNRPPQTVTGTGVDETAALRNLDDRLSGVPQPNGSRMAERECRILLAYLEGAEGWSRETTGARTRPGSRPSGRRGGRTEMGSDAGASAAAAGVWGERRT